ncbi:MAG: sugar ABC transporter ATP-binding protein [Phycisphaerales bacterium]
MSFLTCTNISKRFGPTQALSDVTVEFRAGEVHALMGENGAGKSTLGKAIAGLHKPDTGSITLNGRELKLGDVHDAFDAGIRIVHQELAQCPNLSVAENLCLHAIPTRSGLVDRSAMNERAKKLLAKLAPEIDVTAPLGTLAPGRRQIVQIASSLDDDNGKRKPKVIIFDEPTSSLSMAEADRLMTIVRQLASEGLLAIYVSHRMNEIFTCCDRITVLRDGKFVATSVIKETAESDIISQMIGRTIDASRSHRRDTPVPPTVPPMLEVRNLTSPGKLHNISLAVKPGEVLGLGGLVGAGRSELLDAIFGLDKRAYATVKVDGQTLPLGGTNSGPKPAIAAGVGYVPEDRRLQGLFFQLGVDENIVSPLMHILAHLGLRSATSERQLVTERLKRLQVKTASQKSLPGELSGGNQQKLLIARWLDKKTKILLLDEPTRGIDVGTKAEIYRLIREAANTGLAVLLVSSEMPELLLLSDRIAVLCEGQLTGELTGPDMTQENILRLATATQGGREAS